MLTQFNAIEVERFTEKTFTWPYAALESPNFVLLRKGKVVFNGKMKPNEQETTYSITLVRIAIIVPYHHFDLDCERRSRL